MTTDEHRTPDLLDLLRHTDNYRTGPGRCPFRPDASGRPVTAAISIAWAEQIMPWLIAIPLIISAVALLILTVADLDPDTWPVHDTKDGEP